MCSPYGGRTNDPSFIKRLRPGNIVSLSLSLSLSLKVYKNYSVRSYIASTYGVGMKLIMLKNQLSLPLSTETYDVR